MLNVVFKRYSYPATVWLVVLVAAAWGGNLIYALGAPGGLAKEYAPALVATAMISFCTIHGMARYGGRLFAGFVATVFLIGWTFETVSILTGIPFGTYHYTEMMAPFLGHVPVFVLPAYGVMGYVSWSLASLILGHRRARLDAHGARWVPVLASGLMVIWDLSMDPLRASVEGRWIWVDGGAHHGVPVLNYFGWFVVTWLMFKVFAALTHRFAQQAPKACDTHPSWRAVPAIYLAFSVEYLVNPLTGHGLAADIIVNGQAIKAQVIFLDTALLAGVTMVPMALLGVVCLWRPDWVRARLLRSDIKTATRTGGWRWNR